MSIEVFVYGTLKPGEANYQHYCEGKVVRAIEAYTWGQLFHLPLLGYPGMTVGDSKVNGFVLTFRDSSILASLDELESYDERRSSEENEYQRQKISVYTVIGEPLGRVWGYVMSFEKVRQLEGILVPSGLWQGREISRSI
jgi:gamma-glutamylcyclotransferase (GGCT)/AIG2-like uncharacterized protein YtfP